jgi:hypothetical protein
MSAINRVGIKTSFAALDIVAVPGAAPSRTLLVQHLPSVTRITTNSTALSNFTVNVPLASTIENVSLDEIRLKFAVAFALAGQTVTIDLGAGDEFFGLSGASTLVLTAAADGEYQEVTIQSPPRVQFDDAVDTTVKNIAWTVADAVNVASPGPLSSAPYVFGGTGGPLAGAGTVVVGPGLFKLSATSTITLTGNAATAFAVGRLDVTARTLGAAGTATFTVTSKNVATGAALAADLSTFDFQIVDNAG